MDKTVQALVGLSAVDDQLSDREPFMDGLDLALKERRAALRRAIPTVFLAAYDALGRVGRRPVVVEMRGAHCGGCYLRLPPQLDSSIRRRQSLCICPHCRRLLYSRSRASENEDANGSKRILADRPAMKGSASKRVRHHSGGQLSRQEPRAAKQRQDRRARERRINPGSAGASPVEKNSVRR